MAADFRLFRGHVLGRVGECKLGEVSGRKCNARYATDYVSNRTIADSSRELVPVPQARDCSAPERSAPHSYRDDGTGAAGTAFGRRNGRCGIV